MARYTCQRCGQVCHTTEPEHLCKDLARRLARQQRQEDEVVNILTIAFPGQPGHRAAARRIVRALNALNIGADV